MAEVFEGRPTLAPAICFICEAANEGKWIDTHRNFDPVGASNLVGRKFVCGGCVETFAKKLGFLSPEAAAKLEAELDILVGKLYEAQKKEKIADASILAALEFASDFGFVPAARAQESVPDTEKVAPAPKKPAAKKAS